MAVSVPVVARSTFLYSRGGTSSKNHHVVVPHHRTAVAVIPALSYFLLYCRLHDVANNNLPHLLTIAGLIEPGSTPATCFATRKECVHMRTTAAVVAWEWLGRYSSLVPSHLPRMTTPAGRRFSWHIRKAQTSGCAWCTRQTSREKASSSMPVRYVPLYVCTSKYMFVWSKGDIEGREHSNIQISLPAGDLRRFSRNGWGVRPRTAVRVYRNILRKRREPGGGGKFRRKIKARGEHTVL